MGSLSAQDRPHQKNAKKEGITIIHAGARDATKPMPAVHEKYDKVLLDAPCSGLGVLSHKVEIRWRRTREDLQEFPPLQKALLEEAAKYLKKGGTLVYSTCTLNSKENEDIVTAFLRDHPEFAPIDSSWKALAHPKRVCSPSGRIRHRAMDSSWQS